MNVFWVQNLSQYLVIVENTDFSAINLKARASVASEHHPLLFFAPWTGRKLFGVFVCQRTDFQDVTYLRGNVVLLLNLTGDVNPTRGFSFSLVGEDLINSDKQFTIEVRNVFFGILDQFLN